MSTALADAPAIASPAPPDARLELLESRVATLEGRVSRLAPPSQAAPIPGDWREALRQLQAGWASMDPEHQAEALRTFAESDRRIREADGEA